MTQALLALLQKSKHGFSEKTQSVQTLAMLAPFQTSLQCLITFSEILIFPFPKKLKWISKSVCLLCMLCKRLYIAELFTRLLFRCCVSVCKITNAESPNTHLTQQTQHFSISSEIFSVGRINRNHIFLGAASIIKTSTSFFIDSVNY